MKSHKVVSWPAFSGTNSTDDPSRINDDEAQLLLNGVCDPTGMVKKWDGIYPVTTAGNMGVLDTDSRSKLHTLAKARGKGGDQRAVAILGTAMLRSGPNNIYGAWTEITYPTTFETPVLDRPAAFAFRNRYCYHQNGVDIPFRVKMEEDDGSVPSAEAEVLGLFPPPWSAWNYSGTVGGTLFPEKQVTSWAVTYVYGERGESGPAPPAFANYVAGDEDDSVTFNIPLGPTGVTKRRIYRTKIGGGKITTNGSPWTNTLPVRQEYFLLAEIDNNTTASYTDSKENSALDYNTRMPPPRPFPPRAKYQLLHQDRFAWANLRDNPLVIGIASNPGTGATSATVAVSNTGNGTITLDADAGGDVSIDNYKTKTMRTILQEIMTDLNLSVTATGTGITSMSGTGFMAVPAPGIDIDRTYRFRTLATTSCLGANNIVWLEAIDDEDDAVVVDGCEKFPNRVMWSNVTYPEEINPLNTVDIGRHDTHPITGLFHNDYTLGISQEIGIWLLTGSLSADPKTFAPNFSIARSQSEHGSFCTRPDAMVPTPQGLVFIARDGLRLFRGQASERFGRQIKDKLMERILNEPRARDNVSLCYNDGKLYVSFPGVEVA